MPKEFGVFALASAGTSILFLFFGPSFRMAAINLSQEEDIFDTLMWVSIIAGVCAAGFGLIISIALYLCYNQTIALIFFVLSCVQIFHYCAYIYILLMKRRISNIKR